MAKATGRINSSNDKTILLNTAVLARSIVSKLLKACMHTPAVSMVTGLQQTLYRAITVDGGILIDSLVPRPFPQIN